MRTTSKPASKSKSAPVQPAAEAVRRLWSVESLPSRVAFRRQQLGLSLREAAELTGIGHPKISRIERGVHSNAKAASNGGMSVATLVRLAVAFEVSTDWLCGLSEHQQPAQQRSSGVLSVSAARARAQKRPLP